MGYRQVGTAQQLKHIMADILDLNVNAIDSCTTKDNTASWDSLNHVTLLVALEEEFQVCFDVGEMESMFSFGQILETLERKLQS